MVTLGELVHEWAGHDLMHTVQGESAPAAVHRRVRSLEAVFFGCMPRRTFTTLTTPGATI